MAKILNKEPAVYKQEQDNFLRELRKFHDQKGTGFKHIPCINGKEIDLYLLYWLVTAQGGWERVNNRNGWDELLESFDLQPSTVNGSLSLKQTYLRYLDTYEKYYFLGEEEEDESNLYFGGEDSRARRQSRQKIVQNVPTTYNDNQHRIAENLRAHYGLSTDIYRKTDYDRLGLSLLSPLPNEQDFAINVCTLLSNEGRHTLKLGKCPRLLDLLLAHAGVFNHHNLRDYVSNSYQTVRNYDQVKFWRDVCKEKTVLELIYDERNFYPKPDPADGEASTFKAVRNDSQVDEDLPTTGRQRIEALKARAEEELDDQDDELFSGGRGNGTKELTGQRVLQVATVIRNLSFEEDNSPVLAKNLTCLRFVLLCVNSCWANLNQMGFDILSNIASCVQLEEPSEDAVTDLLFQTLSRCIGAQDRFQVISSLDVLNKLCGQQANEDFIQRLLDQSVYGQLVEYLSLHDIHLLITVLECLYSLTSLGEIPCTALVKTHSAIELLVSLVTVEAQSYGPKACILMRVVETVPGTTAAGAQQGQPNTAGAPLPVTSATGAPLRPAMLPTQPLPQPQVSNILPRHPMPLTRPPIPVAAQAAPQMAAPPRPSGPPGSQQVQLRVSNDEPHRVFCLSWLKATYEPCPGKSIEQNIMYKQYLASMHRMGRKEVISAQHYALCIRTLFGGSTGPNKKAVGDKVENHYTGIQVRAQPLPLKLTPAQAAAAQEASRQQSQAQTQPQQQQPLQNGVPPQQQVVHQGQIVQVNSQGQIVQGGGGQVVQQKMVAQQPGQQQLVHVNAQGQLVNAQGQVIQGGVVQQVAQPQPPQPAKQVVQVNAQGQQIVVNSQGQQVLVNPQGQQMIQVNAQGQQVVQVNSQGQQVVQVNPQGQIVSQGGQVVVNQAGQVVQQRIVNSQGQIVAQGVVQGGQVIQQGMQTRIQPQTTQVIQQQPAQAVQPVGQVIQRIIHPGGRVEERIVQASAVPGQPGQMVIHGAGGQQQIIKTNPTSQPIQQPGQVSASQATTQPAQVILQASGAGQQQASSTGGHVVVSGGTVARTASPQSQVATSSADSSSQIDLKQPKSAILQDLLKPKNVESSDTKQPDKVLARQATPVSEEIVENGLSPLDGILPKDPKFGLLDGDGFSDLLEKKSENLVNGIVNHQDYSKLNGDLGNGKRSAGDHIDTSPAKRQALESNTVVTNGGSTHGNGSVNGGAVRGGVVVSSVAQGQGQVVVGGQGMVLVSQAGGQVGAATSSGGGQLVQSSSGQLFLKTTNSSGGLVLQPAQQQVQQQVMVPGQGQGQAVLVQQPGGQKQLLFIQPGGGGGGDANMGKAVMGQQIVRQVMVGQPGQAVIQSQAGQVQTQQAVMRVSAPLASVGPASTTQPDTVHQVDGADDQGVDADHGESLPDLEPLPQLDGMTGGGPGEPSQQPVVPQNAVQQQPTVAAAQQSVIQRPTQPTTLTNGRTTPLATGPSPTPSPSPPPQPQVKIDTQKPFLCEWATCMKAFKTPKEVENHAIASHCPLGSDDIPCMWARCDGMKRKRFSLMTHLQDRHCHPQLMKLMAVRRVQIAQSGKSDVPLPPAPPPHPGYAPNAALHAIKRHAVEFVSPKELAMRDEKEGPVTKSIRLTASLILRNLVIYSSLGRSRLRAYESHLSTVALSNVESSRTVSQILYDMANSSDFA